MRRLRVLLTNSTLAVRAGTELYVHDVATALVARGHTPVAYSTVLGEVAEALRRKGVPVVDRLDALAEPPDVIHGQHHIETLTALLHFPGVPAVSFCHGFLPWEEEPLLFPRVRRHVAVDSATRDRLVLGHAVAPERVRVIPDFVDLERFTVRAPLPLRPRRALVFSNHAGEARLVPEVRQACAAAGIAVDVLGLRSGTASASPERVLPGYDLVFATGRSALEAMAVGAAVVLAEVVGIGPMVTAERFDELREANFGLRALWSPVSAEAVARQVARYDAADAALVSRRVRAVAGLGGRRPAPGRVRGGRGRARPGAGRPGAGGPRRGGPPPPALRAAQESPPGRARARPAAGRVRSPPAPDPGRAPASRSRMVAAGGCPGGSPPCGSAADDAGAASAGPPLPSSALTLFLPVSSPDCAPCDLPDLFTFF